MLKDLKSEIAVNYAWTFLCQDQNVFDSKKKVKLTNAEGVEFKLSKKQLQAIEFNKALLAMYTNQVGNRALVPLAEPFGVWHMKHNGCISSVYIFCLYFILTHMFFKMPYVIVYWLNK